MSITTAKEILSRVFSTTTPNSDSIVIHYSQTELEGSTKYKFEKRYRLGWAASESGFPAKVDEVMRAYDTSRKKMAVVVTTTEKDEKKFTIEVTDQHKQIYSDRIKLCYRFSPAQLGSLAYSGLPMSFLQPQTQVCTHISVINRAAETPVMPGTKFDYKETWGEQYEGLSNPSVFVISLEKKKIIKVPGIPEHLTCGQVVWTPDSSGLVFVGWDSRPRRLGIIYCFNRPSSIYYVPLEGIDSEPKPENDETEEASLELDKTVKLTQDFLARSPRFAPCGKKIAFLQSPKDMKTHGGAARLSLLDFETREVTTIVDTVDAPKVGEFPGIYTGTLPSFCFLNESTIVFTSAFNSTQTVLSADITKGAITPQVVAKDAAVLDVKDGVILVKRASYAQAPFVSVINSKTGEITNFQEQENDTNIAVDIVDVHATNPEKYFQYIFLKPTKGGSEGKRPFILFPHGGPHSGFVNDFGHDMTFFVNLGFYVALVNYRGSTGFGNNFLDSLPGKVGEVDVQDCIETVDDVLSRYAEEIDPDKIVYYGGSHGGFLGGHLIATEPRIKGAVLRNPVTDLSSMRSATDIPDWCYVESGTNEADPIQSLVDMYKKSPIAHVDKVKIPVLILLGSSDKRVPPLNGFAYYEELKKRGVKTRLLVYPDDNHALTKPAHVTDLLINSALWFFDCISG